MAVYLTTENAIAHMHRDVTTDMGEINNWEGKCSPLIVGIKYELTVLDPHTDVQNIRLNWILINL